jgi:predicted DNA-binding transcriptional regulator AlpA
MSCERPATTANPELEILTVAEVAQLLRCKTSSVYNLTRRRSVKYVHQIPVIRAPFGLRFRKSDVMAWLDMMAGSHA